ncbi:HAD hydrolase-like protein [Nostocoides vanveenii]|uniref:HAD hydrolase-like protein n=1 Tax=Nostocoides vanveenii TaxID=330835 RepID=A0ABN2KLM5_9MICO
MGAGVTADATPLAGYRGIVCDLDGVVYRGPDPVPYAVDVLGGLPTPVVYATNNASRTPDEVAAHLTSFGLTANAEHVVTSSMAGAAAIAKRVPSGSKVLAVGGSGVAIALRAAGFEPVESTGDGVVAVLQGYGPRVCAADLAEAAYAIESGALWVATNDDLTLPTDRGIAPGNGSLVRCVAIASGAEPVVVGKPQAPLYLMSSAVLGIEPAAVLGVGDRLETDIAGATAAGMDSLLVLTGVHGIRDASLAPVAERPKFVVSDLRGLIEPYAAPTPTPDGWACDGATVRVDGDRVLVACGGPDIAVGRAGLAAIWAAVDAGLPTDRAASLAASLPDRA